MKITKSQIKRIVKEALETVAPKYPPGTLEAGGWGGPDSVGTFYLEDGTTMRLTQAEAKKEAARRGLTYRYMDPLADYHGVALHDY